MNKTKKELSSVHSVGLERERLSDSEDSQYNEIDHPSNDPEEEHESFLEKHPTDREPDTNQPQMIMPTSEIEHSGNVPTEQMAKEEAKELPPGMDFKLGIFGRPSKETKENPVKDLVTIPLIPAKKREKQTKKVTLVLEEAVRSKQSKKSQMNPEAHQKAFLKLSNMMQDLIDKESDEEIKGEGKLIQSQYLKTLGMLVVKKDKRLEEIILPKEQPLSSLKPSESMGSAVGLSGKIPFDLGLGTGEENKALRSDRIRKSINEYEKGMKLRNKIRANRIGPMV